MVKIDTAKINWSMVSTIIGIVVTIVATPIITVQTMKGDIRVLAKQIEEKDTAAKVRFEGIEKELSEMRTLHYKIALKQTEQERNLKGVTTAINPVLAADKSHPIVLPESKVKIDVPALAAAAEVKKKTQ